MQLNVQGKHIDVGDSLTQHMRENLIEAANKYFPNPIEATVLVVKEAGHRIKSDITIHLGKDIILKAHAEEGDAYASFDTALEKLSKRMRRYNRKMKDHHKRISEVPPELEVSAVLKTFKALEMPENEDPKEDDIGEPTVVAEMVTTVQEMSVSDAVMRLELANANAMMFKNIENGAVNMVYRRHDNHIGWVDPTWDKSAKA